MGITLQSSTRSLPADQLIQFDLELMQNIRVISARTCDIEKEAMSAHCVFEVKVLPQFCNRMQNMHGGCVALLADMTTTMCTAPVSKEDFWRFGGWQSTDGLCWALLIC